MGQAGSVEPGVLPKGVTKAAGKPTPRGCSEVSKGKINFVLDAPGRNSAWLVLIIPDGHAALGHFGLANGGAELMVPLNPAENRSGDTWHIELSPSFPAAGVKYAWLLDPPLEGNGFPARHALRIIDPCAKVLDSQPASAWNRRDQGKYSPLPVIPDRRVIQEFDWQGVKPPGLHMKDLVIYEAHVRGFTKNPDSCLTDQNTHAGTYAGFIEKIPHLLRLGINCVELLPVFEFDETACPRKNPHNGEQLCNYWGYSTVSFYCPMQRFSSRNAIGGAIVGFKTLVRELHRQGIEVILDVVFNHTAEGTWGENNWHSLSAIAKHRYYILSHGKDTNYTGCGNTINANDGLCTEWIVECLRFWVEEMHVDGFRFDLASALTRGGDGQVQPDPWLMRRIAQEPGLNRAKLIAEPWDCSWPDGYLVGRFPSGGPPRWAEWNGIFRDTVRRFIKGDEFMKGDFATRICGSSDLFEHSGRGPFHSINFITAHDGFTLRDLVTYNGKHNECNGENSGDDHNNSWNCGHEGETGDGGVKHMREKQIRNFLVALLLSAGTPMLTFGDEYGRSQRGCNNGWCQDALSWFSWSNCQKEEGKLLRFTRRLIGLRKQFSHIFCRTHFVTGKDIWWRHEWDDPYNYVCYILHDHQPNQDYGALLIAFNAGHEGRHCDLPKERKWYRLIDTNLPPPKDIVENDAEAVEIKDSYGLQPYSCIVLRSPPSGKTVVDYSQVDKKYSQAQDVEDHVKEVINRRMSQELMPRMLSGSLLSRNSFTGIGGLSRTFSGGAADPVLQEDIVSIMKRNASRSGIAFIDDDEAKPDAAPTFEPPQRKAPEPPKPAEPVIPARPEGLDKGDKVIETGLGGSRHAEIFVHQGEEVGDMLSSTLEVVVRGFAGQALLVHWGSIESMGGPWKQPPDVTLQKTVPPSTAVPGAVQTRFPPADEEGVRRVFLPFRAPYVPMAVEFVLHGPPNEWLKNGHGNFFVNLPKPSKHFDAALQAVKATMPDDALQRTASWNIGGMRLSGIIGISTGGCLVGMVAETEAPLMLHFGPGDENRKWLSAKSEDFQPCDKPKMKQVLVSIPAAEMAKYVMFVLKMDNSRWVKDGAQDFAIEVPQDPRVEAAKAEAKAKEEATALERLRKIDEAAANYQDALASFKKSRSDRQKKCAVAFQGIDLADEAGCLDVGCRKEGDGFEVEVLACLNPKVAPATSSLLHWGSLTDFRRKGWACPPEDILPKGTKLFDAKACQTPFEPVENNLYGFSFYVPAAAEKTSEGAVVPSIIGMGFVLRVEEGNKWIKSADGKDAVVLFYEPVTAGSWKGSWKDVANEIVSAEVEWSHMTLMHRYNLCKSLVEKWESKSTTGEAAMRRLRSWNSMMKTDSFRRGNSFNRMPSFSLTAAIAAEDDELNDLEFWSWIFVWQRASFMRLLDWQRNYNTKPRELAGATDGLAGKICAVWKEHPNVRLWCRWTLATLGRGGNRGQEIRDEILHIMHRNKIPETAGHFYEQWHQKLHNNTTPDDIGICKALIAFLRSGGQIGEYWRVLSDHGITEKRLTSYERAITKEPYMHGDAGKLILEFENYLKILQSVHDALDLQTSIEASKWCLPGDLLQKLQDICGSGGDNFGRRRSRSSGNIVADANHQKFIRLADARSGLLALLNDKGTKPDAIRQLLLLDYSLESQQTVLIQGMGKEDRLPVLCDQMKALLMGLVGHMPLYDELTSVLVDWGRLAPDCAALRYNNNAVESALLLKAMCDRLSRCVGGQVDEFQGLMLPKVKHLGTAIGADAQVIDIFVDEVLRGTALFSVSLQLQRLEPLLREIAHLPPWQMIAAVTRPIRGELQVVEKMFHMQDKIFETPTILLSGAVSGEEEVPVGVQGVLVRDAASAPDILSHCAVRARNAGVLLASCFDPTITARIEAELVGEWVEVTCKPDGTLTVERASRPNTNKKLLRKASRSLIGDAQDMLESGGGDTKLVNMNLTNDLKCKWVVTPDEMNKNVVGSKSLNLALLSPKLPKEVKTPQAVAMPYGCMQKALSHPDNAKKWLPKLQACLEKLQPTSSNDEATKIFEQARELVASLVLPQELSKALSESMEAVAKKDGEGRLTKLFEPREAWEATKQVWASLFAPRPWISLAKAGRSFHDLNMAVLVQELLPAKYAFVLHTKNPFSNDPDEVYGEIVPGRGETLVGNFPGRALSFRAKKGKDPVVSSFLSKSQWLRTQECLIFRSDSNGEDLEGFAGAGLFESICAQADVPCTVRFHRLQLIMDPKYRLDILKRLAEVGRQVEKAFGGAPQDIEGCIDPQDRIFIVQSRPQV
eukprot:CAMPEP_0206439612 /NCGR_PEP_ID=MMETSP0324_2-20121206/12309_1 /ASSEMBLY_ACC=CAM_ASM_000836 /TAXON_ID=2866 /ORGANISM="Crypthecodinium cohnii, Strain Seligo" /LENGTH=2296 /DNA_ID=CAMNT_0053907255 /DNA_START=112 /DNA_END=7002 /DNA_ORIENTATION=-